MRTGLTPLTVALEDVCFCHWPVSPDLVAGLIPDWLEPDVADDDAWVSVLPMTMARFDVFGLPVRTDVRAVNLRTYVRSPAGDRGVYFLSLDATDRPAVEAARRLFRLPYHHAEITRTAAGDETVVDARRTSDDGASFAVTYRASGPTRTASPDTLATFLTERYRYFTTGPMGTHLVGSVGHDPWRLRSASATVTDTGLIETVGLADADPEPLAHVSRGTQMTIGPPVPVARRD